MQTAMGWCETKLGAVATIERRVVSPATFAAQATYVGLEHITGDGAITPRTVVAGELRSSKFAFSDRHVLYGKLRPYLRKIARPSTTGICSTDILPILPGPDLDRDYLFHWLRQPRIVSLATVRSDGVNLPRVSPTTLLELPFLLPSLDEQRRIAATLDKADAVQRKQRERMRLLDELLRSSFQEMFGDPAQNQNNWNVVRLEDIAEIVSGVTKGRNIRNRRTKLLPYLRVANVQDGHINLDEVKMIAATSDEVARLRLEPGDILLTEGGDPDKLGRGAVWRGEIEECIHQNHVFRVRLTSAMLVADYVSALLQSSFGKRYFLKAAKQTTGIASINRTQLSGFPVLMAPVALQERYRSVLLMLRQLAGRLDKASASTDQLFDSLAQAAFGGDPAKVPHPIAGALTTDV